jgi:hypothetical protein
MRLFLTTELVFSDGTHDFTVSSVCVLGNGGESVESDDSDGQSIWFPGVVSSTERVHQKAVMVDIDRGHDARA